MKVRHSLFFRFFLMLIALSTFPMVTVTFFLVATYQARISDAVSPDVARELLLRAGIQFFLIFLFVLVLTAFSAFMVSRNISRPLSTLMEAVRLIGRGKLDVNIKVRRRDEIGVLGKFFNEMAIRLKEVKERQEQISRLKSEFIAVAAHQLRTPLSATKWAYNSILEGDVGKVPAEQRELLKKAAEANESMIRLVHNLLDAVRIEEGKFGYKFERMDVSKFLEGLLELKKILAREKKIKIVLKNEAGKVLFIDADPDRLSMALGNIIDNAIRYTPEGGKVTLTCSADSGHVQFSIADSGVGISDEDKGRLFTKFYRGTNVKSMEPGGTGLGLFIMKNIIEKHAGTVRFESEQGKGTTFFIVLPKRMPKGRGQTPLESVL